MSSSSVQGIFTGEPEFCSVCGSILPIPSGTSLDEQCFVCRSQVGREKGSEEISYVIHFNDPDVYTRELGTGGKGSKKKKPQAEGPVVDRECRQCGNMKMSYATLQLRSADEGQTVFYTCTKCKFKESENS